MKQLLATLLLVMFVCAVGLAQDRGAFEKDYGVITDHNLFLRDLHKPRPPTTQRSDWRNGRENDVVREAPERNFVLRGIVIEDNELRAYVENTRTGQMLRMQPGEAVASGRIDEIVIDAVSYEANGQIVWIDVGHNLAGTRVIEVPRGFASVTGSGAATQPAASGATGQPGAGGATTPVTGGEGLSIEELMRRRRAMMNGGAAPAAPTQEGPRP